MTEANRPFIGYDCIATLFWYDDISGMFYRSILNWEDLYARPEPHTDDMRQMVEDLSYVE